MAGYTERVDTLITVLNDCAKNKYTRKIASEAIKNSQTGVNVETSDGMKNKTESMNRAAGRKQSVCLEFDHNGAPMIQGLVTESLDDSILLENVSSTLFIDFVTDRIKNYFLFNYLRVTNLHFRILGTNSYTELRHCGSFIIIESN